MRWRASPAETELYLEGSGGRRSTSRISPLVNLATEFAIASKNRILEYKQSVDWRCSKPRFCRPANSSRDVYGGSAADMDLGVHLRRVLMGEGPCTSLTSRIFRHAKDIAPGVLVSAFRTKDYQSAVGNPVSGRKYGQAHGYCPH